MTYLLTAREQQCITTLDARYMDYYGDSPALDPDLVYFLGDNPSWSVCWSAASRQLPTFRRSIASAKMWSPMRRRWMTAPEVSKPQCAFLLP